MLLILALLFCPSPAEEELRVVKQKIRGWFWGILCVMIPPFTINKK